jgi:hypothetical protein
MPEQPTVFAFVKLKYWEVYRLNVILTLIGLRRVLYIWVIAAIVWIGLLLLLHFQPYSEKDWAVMLRNSDPLKWGFAIPILIFFLTPVLSARSVMRNEMIKQGISYRISDLGLHVETSVSKTDLQWAAIYHVRELSSEFLVFTNRRIAFTLPKRCFNSTESISQVRGLFRANVKKANLRTG